MSELNKEERDKIAEKIIEREKKKHTMDGWFDKNDNMIAMVILLITFIFVGIAMYFGAG